MDQMTNASSAEIPDLKLAETSAGTISFREAGSGDALLFLHGMNGSSKSWAYQFGAFAGEYRVIAWDAPGYGRSDPVVAEADAYAAQADRLLTHLGIERAVVLGHSMGGVIAERFCARYLYRAKRLVLSGTHWGNAAPADAPLARKYTKRLEELEALPAREYGEARAKKMLPESSPPEAFKLVAEIAAEAKREGLLNGGRMVEKTDNRPFLGSLNLPVLILTGEHDTVVSPERSEAMLAYLPNARAVSLPGVGHAAYLEAPEVFNEAIRQFIGADVK